jgi:IS4 transposase
VVVFDRGYSDYEWFAELGRRGVFFVTRLKRGAAYKVVASRLVPQRSRVVSDEVISFPGCAEASPEYLFRRIVVEDPGRDEPLVFLTNHLGFGATTVAAIYKDRWQVELFFKTLKQNLRENGAAKLDHEAAV